MSSFHGRALGGSVISGKTGGVRNNISKSGGSNFVQNSKQSPTYYGDNNNNKDDEENEDDSRQRYIDVRNKNSSSSSSSSSSSNPTLHKKAGIENDNSGKRFKNVELGANFNTCSTKLERLLADVFFMKRDIILNNISFIESLYESQGLIVVREDLKDMKGKHT